MNSRPILFFLLAAALPVRAQEPDGNPALIEHAKIVGVEAEPAAAPPGETFQLIFKVRIDPEWHIYSARGTYSPTEWELEGPFERNGDVTETKTKHHRQELSEDVLIEYDYHEGEVEFRVPVRAKKDAAAGRVKVTGFMTGQECDPNGCIEFKYPFETDFEILPPPHTKIAEVKAEPATAKSGETVTLVFKVSIDPGWHIYSAVKEYNRTRWEFDAGSPAEVAGQVEESEPKYERMDFGKDAEGNDSFLEYWSHEGDVTFRVPVTIKAGTKPGPLKLAGKLVGQECSDVCVDIAIPFEAELTIAPGAGAVSPPPQASKTPPQDPGDASTEATRELETRGLAWLMGLAVLGGLVSLVMPCVYPLIPITITFFAKQAGLSRSHGILLSLAYAAGIIITFTAIGFLLIVLLGAQGAQIFASDPWVNLAIAAVFGVFALSLLGLFEFKLPAFVTNLAGGAGPRTGIGGAFTLGLLFSVITFTCTIPIAGTIFAVAASGTHRAAGVSAMFVYSFVMAIPFLLLGFFPSLVKELPRSGGWLHTMKIAAGLFEIALAAAYIWKADNIWGWGFFDRPVVLSIWIAVSFILALYLLGLFRVKGDSESAGIGVGRILSGCAFGAIGFFLVGGLLGRPLGVFAIVLPPEVEVSTKGAEGIEAYEHLAEAEAKSRSEGKPLFIEFTGIT